MKLIYKIFCTILILGFNLFVQALENLSPKGIEKLDKIIGIIKEKHIKTISEEKLIEDAINGILTSLDPYSYFYNNKSLKEINTYTQGTFNGIGIEVQVDAGKAIIITPLINSPATHAGILPGDKIIAINGKLIEGLSRHKIMEALLGKPHTKVQLTITRENSAVNPIKFSIIRKKVDLLSVESKIFPDGIFYIKIGAFYENTATIMKNVINKIKTFQDTNVLKGIIIDLRNNPGGILESAIDVASFFIKKGNLVSISSPKTTKQIKYLAKKTPLKLDNNIPIAVLINRGTASAAEVLTGALQDHKRATIVGEKSFGKGSVQVFIPLANGEAMSITTAVYKTPKGNIIEKIGIIPDIKISKNKYKNSKQLYNTRLIKEKKNTKEKDDFLNWNTIINKAIAIMTGKDI